MIPDGVTPATTKAAKITSRLKVRKVSDLESIFMLQLVFIRCSDAQNKRGRRQDKRGPINFERFLRELQ